MAGSIITALKAAGISPLPPVTGQDAELAGVQRIVADKQFMNVCKPYAPEAAAAAEMAVALAKSEKLDTIATPIQYMITGGVLLATVVIDSLTHKTQKTAAAPDRGSVGAPGTVRGAGTSVCSPEYVM
jgi:D-xylose transport system substrate-binding protein